MAEQHFENFDETRIEEQDTQNLKRSLQGALRRLLLLKEHGGNSYVRYQKKLRDMEEMTISAGYSNPELQKIVSDFSATLNYVTNSEEKIPHL